MDSRRLGNFSLEKGSSWKMETATETLERLSPPPPLSPFVPPSPSSPSPPPSPPPPFQDTYSKFDDEDVSSPSVTDAIPEIEGDIAEYSSPVAKEEEAAAFETAPAVLTDDLRDKIVRQVEYYFSDENLPSDKFMLKQVIKDKQGFVFIGVIASFKKMKRLVKDLSLIEAALRTSSKLVVSKDGKKVKRLHPLPLTEKEKDTKTCTVIAENLPDDYSKENLEKIFSNAGKILNVTIHDPHSVEESNVKTTLSTKLHALIVYETAEAAANAVSTLNNEKNWRSGMRVEVLQKWMGKYGMVGKRYKEAVAEKSKKTSERSSDGHVSKSDARPPEKSEKEDENQFASGKGNHRDRYRKGRGQQNTTGLGHGQTPPSSSHGVSKPPPGPKMPDGTRGFTIGRGKSFVSPPN